MQNSDKTKELVLKLARDAGTIMLEHFGIGIKKEWKQDLSPLTKADTIINKLSSDWVHKNFPDSGFLGEEGDNFNTNAESLWVCDPIDGTIPFSHAIPTCNFGIAHVLDGTPMLGVIYDPFLNRMFYAEKGKGAWCNQKQIHVSKLKKFKQGAIGSTIWKTEKFNTEGFNTAMRDRDAFVICHAATMYPGSLVAAGELIANVWPGPTPWDIAPIKIIVEEAGGKHTDIFGNEQRYDTDIKGSIASNGYIHDELVDIVNKAIQQQKG